MALRHGLVSCLEESQASGKATTKRRYCGRSGVACLQERRRHPNFGRFQTVAGADGKASLHTIGAPSNVVATEDGVPGILRRIAEIKPPDVPPTYSAISIAIPFNAPIPYVMGRQSATAMVDVNPGIEPKMMPIITPSAHRRIVNGLILDNRPAIATLLDIL